MAFTRAKNHVVTFVLILTHYEVSGPTMSGVIFLEMQEAEEQHKRDKEKSLILHQHYQVLG